MLHGLKGALLRRARLLRHLALGIESDAQGGVFDAEGVSGRVISDHGNGVFGRAQLDNCLPELGEGAGGPGRRGDVLRVSGLGVAFNSVADVDFTGFRRINKTIGIKSCLIESEIII